jgi:hypothetical protein
MILILRFDDIPPMPRNRSHMLVMRQNKPMNIKTQLCKEFEKTIEQVLKHGIDDLREFKSLFDPMKHYLSAEYFIYTPSDVLFTVEGKISARSVDLDAHKVFQDTLMRCIGIDDKCIRDARYFSPVSHDGNWNYVVIYKLESLCNLKSTFTSIQNIIERTKDVSTSFALL